MRVFTIDTSYGGRPYIRGEFASEFERRQFVGDLPPEWTDNVSEAQMRANPQLAAALDEWDQGGGRVEYLRHYAADCLRQMLDRWYPEPHDDHGIRPGLYDDYRAAAEAGDPICKAYVAIAEAIASVEEELETTDVGQDNIWKADPRLTESV